MIDVIEIGKRIESARKDLNLTQEEQIGRAHV